MPVMGFCLILLVFVRPAALFADNGDRESLKISDTCPVQVIQTVEWESASGRMRLERMKDRWLITEPERSEADYFRMTTFLTNLTEVVRFEVSEGNETHPLQGKELKISLWHERSGVPIVFTFWEVAQSQIIATVGGRDVFYRVCGEGNISPDKLFRFLAQDLSELKVPEMPGTMAFLWMILYTSLKFFVFFFLPGLAITRIFFSEELKCSETVALSLALGSSIPPLIAFGFALLSNRIVTIWILLAVSASITLFLSRPLFRDIVGLLRSGDRVFSMPSPKSIIVLILSLGCFGLYLIRYDIHEFGWSNGCITDAVNLSVGALETVAKKQRDVLGEVIHMYELPITNHMLDNYTFGGFPQVGGQRLGTTAVLSSYAVVFKMFGFRLFYGVLGLTLALLAFHTAERILGSYPLSLLCMLILVCNPNILSLAYANENTIGLMLISAIVLLLLYGKIRWFIVGVLFGHLLWVRHILVFFIPGLLYYFFAKGFSGAEKGKIASRLVVDGILLVLGVSLAMSLCFYWHKVGYGKILIHENSQENPPVEHCIPFTSKTFEYTNLLNYPFTDDVVRTPGNPFPTFLLLPLTLVRDFGILGSALGLLGAFYLFREKRRIFLLLALLFLPFFLFLCMHELWGDTRKMTFLFLILLPVALFIVSGIQGLTTGLSWDLRGLVRGLSRSILLVVLIAALLSAVKLARPMDFKADLRLVSADSLEGLERKEELDEKRRSYTEGNIFPKFAESLGWRCSACSGTKIRDLMYDFLHKEYDRPYRFSGFY